MTLIGKELNIGVSTSCFQNDNLLKLIENLLDNGINIIELRLEKESNIPSVWPWELMEKDLTRLLKKFEIIGFHLPFIELSPLSSNPKIRDLSQEIILEGVINAYNMGASYVVIHLNSRFTNANEKFMKWKKYLETIFDAIEETPLYLCIENAGDFRRFDDLKELMETINNSKAKMMIDTGHAYSRIKAAPLSYFLKYLDNKVGLFPWKKSMPFEKDGSLTNFITNNLHDIYGFHIHDNSGKRDHLNLGKGKIDFSFLSYLSQQHFKGPLIIESRMNSYKEIERNINFMLRFVR